MTGKTDIRCGDVVKHGPSGEMWLVAYVDNDYLSWCGWPPGEAKVIDCTLVKKCSDEEHVTLLKQVAEIRQDGRVFDRRPGMARVALAALGIEHN